MAERDAQTDDVARMLMTVLDENVQYLRGAVAAANGLSDAIFDTAEDASTLGQEHIGLRWALAECEAAVAALSDDLHATHHAALRAAGLPTPADRARDLSTAG